MLSWDDFRYVKAIAETRSLAGAAEQLGINHSTVFRRLSQIEQHLGSRLFERGRGGYALTACGEEMVGLAQRLGDDIITFERKVTGQDLRPSGELRITTSDVILLRILNDVLIGFRRAYPEIVLELIVSNRLLNLSKREADVALRATYLGPESLAGRRVSRLAWAVYGSRSLAEKPFNLETSGREHDWAAFGDNISIAKALRWLREHVDQNRIVYKTNTMIALAEAAAAGSAVFRRRSGSGIGGTWADFARTRRGAVARHAPRPAQYRTSARFHGLLRRRDRQASQRDRGAPRARRHGCGGFDVPANMSRASFARDVKSKAALESRAGVGQGSSGPILTFASLLGRLYCEC